MRRQDQFAGGRGVGAHFVAQRQRDVERLTEDDHEEERQHTGADARYDPGGRVLRNRAGRRCGTVVEHHRGRHEREGGRWARDRRRPRGPRCRQRQGRGVLSGRRRSTRCGDQSCHRLGNTLVGLIGPAFVRERLAGPADNLAGLVRPVREGIQAGQVVVCQPAHIQHGGRFIGGRRPESPGVELVRFSYERGSRHGVLGSPGPLFTWAQDYGIKRRRRGSALMPWCESASGPSAVLGLRARTAASPSSRGLGRGPFKAKTRVRIPSGTPTPTH